MWQREPPLFMGPPINIMKRTWFLNSEGQIAVLLALIFPLFVLLLAFFVNMGLLIHQKIRLQNAVDAGVYSSVASISRDLNRITDLNRQIQMMYDGDPSKNVDCKFESSSLKDTVAGDPFNEYIVLKLYVTEYLNSYQACLDQIDEVNEKAVQKAIEIGRYAALMTFYNGNEVMADLNPNSFSFSIQSQEAEDKLFRKDYNQYTIKEELCYVANKKNCVGVPPFDNPFDYCTNKCVKKNFNLPISKEAKVDFAAMAEADVGFVNILSTAFRVEAERYNAASGQIHLTTYAAGQPYSGSVKGLRDTYRASLIKISDVISEHENVEEFWH